LKETGQLDEAITYYKKAIQINPTYADTFNNLGLALQEKGQIEEAELAFNQAIKIDPDYAYAYYNLGNVLMEKKHIDEALTCYQKAIDINPDLLDAYKNLGNALKEKGLHNDAITTYRKILRIESNRPDIYYNLGIVLKETGQLAEAIAYYQKALHLNPAFADAHNNLGLAFRDTGEIRDAIHSFQRAVQIEPDNAIYHWNLSLALLLSGDFEQGWKEYEWRLKVKDLPNRMLSRQVWDGSDIAGRTILLQAEQGFGDTIQFIRYAPLVAEMGVRVFLSCQDELASLSRSVDGLHTVVGYREPMPHFDVYQYLLNLPLLLHTNLDSIPARIPYIKADLSLVRTWKTKLGDRHSRQRIGLVWAGREQRSCSLSMFRPLAQAQNISFYSLQKGEAAAQTKNPPEGMKLIDFTEEIHDFSDTAAFIENLDLVISVDTAVAHLAGALGKPVWTLLPFVPDWRWLLHRNDSPWYPTMRLFRQPAPGDWASVIEKIATELLKNRRQRQLEYDRTSPKN
jgi:tetratricopeptide (TPR) repeat protein